MMKSNALFLSVLLAGPQKYECGISADGEIYVYP